MGNTRVMAGDRWSTPDGLDGGVVDNVEGRRVILYAEGEHPYTGVVSSLAMYPGRSGGWIVLSDIHSVNGGDGWKVEGEEVRDFYTENPSALP